MRSFEIMASLVTAGSRPTPGGNERPDGVSNQNASEKNACQQGWCRQLHETGPCLVMDNLIAYAIFPQPGELFLTTLRLQPDLDKAADGFGAGNIFVLF